MQDPKPYRKERVVMIVEAGEIGLSTRKLVVETAGFNCISAVSIEQTLNLLDRHPIDLLLFDTDVNPGQVTAEFLSKLKNERNIPVFLLTGMPWIPDELRQIVNGNFQKTQDPSIMVDQVVRLLG